MKKEDVKNYKICGEMYHEWIIQDWNSINDEEYSSEFIINGHKWYNLYEIKYLYFNYLIYCLKKFIFFNIYIYNM